MDEIDFKDFYDVIKENLDSYDEDYPNFINYGPNLFKLITNILNEKEVNNQLRLRLCAAIAYYVAPFDIIPEAIYGPKGYIDDIFVCVYVIKEVEEKKGLKFLENLWEGKENLEYVINECYTKSIDVLTDKIEPMLEYVGLD